MSLFQAMIKQKDYSAANSEYKDVRFKRRLIGNRDKKKIQGRSGWVYFKDRPPW